MPFTLVQRQKAYINIAEQIAASIREGVYRIGDRLPSARELEATFGVSRPTVREALSALELAGVIEIRTGQGAFVASLPTELRNTGSGFRLDQGESPGEVLELRLVLEPQAARLAAERATSEEIAELTGTLHDFRQHMQDQEPGILGDIRFHVAIAKASRNSVILKVMEGLAEYLNQGLWRSLRERAWMKRANLGQLYFGHHQKVLGAIQQHDGDGAAAAMLEHLRCVQEDLYGDS